MNALLEPLLGKPSLLPSWCVVCGKPAHDAHHVIQGRRNDPTVPRLRLCGMGNTSGCHGKAHERRLHFRYNDGWEWLETEQPTKYDRVVDEEGWRVTRG